MRVRLRRFGFLVTIAINLAMTAYGQQASPDTVEPGSSSAEGTYHLRTYVNRIQLPTMVLGRKELPAKNLTSDAFSISLDAGPWFHPTYSRVEGNDPISLIVLIDASGSQSKLIASATDALASLAPKYLTADDHISIFAADCTMFRTRLNAVPTPDTIESGVRQAMNAVHPTGQKKSPKCGDHFRLYDFISYLLEQAKHLPGRRVALLISGGHEGGSKVSFSQIREQAIQSSTAIFAMREPGEISQTLPDATAQAMGRWRQYQDYLYQLSATSGGYVFNVERTQLKNQLEAFIEIVRSRYVLEFPEPDDAVGGLHQLEVTVPSNKHLMVRSTGIIAAAADPKRKQDPNVLPSQPSPAVLGTRRPVQPSANESKPETP